MTNKFYVDEIYDMLVVKPIELTSRFLLWRAFDVGIVDGAVNGIGALFQDWSVRVKKLQTGYTRVYASWILTGVVLIVLYYVIR